MNSFVKLVLIVASLIISAASTFAAEQGSLGADLKGAASSIGAGVKSDAKSATVSTKGYAKGKVADTKTTAKAKLIDINTATAAEIKTIPGVGDALAEKIIAGRPYTNKSQLKSRKVVPANIYEQIKGLIVAKLVK